MLLFPPLKFAARIKNEWRSCFVLIQDMRIKASWTSQSSRVPTWGSAAFHHQLFILFTKSAAPGHCPPPLGPCNQALTNLFFCLSPPFSSLLFQFFCFCYVFVVRSHRDWDVTCVKFKTHTSNRQTPFATSRNNNRHTTIQWVRSGAVLNSRRTACKCLTPRSSENWQQNQRSR